MKSKSEALQEIVSTAIPFKSNGTANTSATQVIEVGAPKVITAAQLQTMHFEPPKEIVAGLILEGLTILASRPKKGKSWYMLLAALGVAYGWPNLFGLFRATKGRVLYLALEDSEARIKSRVEIQIGQAPWPENLCFAYSWRRLDKGGLADLDEWLTQNPDTVLVVVDTYIRIKPPKGRNSDSYAEDAQWTAAIQEIALRHHCAIVLILHQRKAASDDPFDTVSGTLGNTASADIIMVLDRKPKSGNGTLTVIGRDIEEKSLAMHFDNGIWTCSGDAEGEGEADDPIEAAKDFLRECLMDGPVPSEEIFTRGKLIGITNKRLWSAKGALHVKAQKKSFDGGWEWSLPFSV